MATIKAGTEFRDPNGRLYCTTKHDMLLIGSQHRVLSRENFIWPDGLEPPFQSLVPGWFIRQLNQLARRALDEHSRLSDSR